MSSKAPSPNVAEGDDARDHTLMTFTARKLIELLDGFRFTPDLPLARQAHDVFYALVFSTSLHDHRAHTLRLPLQKRADHMQAESDGVGHGIGSWWLAVGRNGKG
jgi:hypothetical protein